MYYIERAKRVLKFIEKYFLKQKYYPSIREIAKNQKLSVQGVYITLNKLKVDGYIEESNERERRKLVLTEKAKNLIK